MRMPAPGKEKRAGTARRAPTPKLDRHAVIFNLDFGGHVPEVSSTSRPMASRRSVSRVALRPVGGRGTADGIAVRCPGESYLHSALLIVPLVSLTLFLLGLVCEVQVSRGCPSFRTVPVTMSMRVDASTLANGLSASRPSGFEVPGASPSRVSQRLVMMRQGRSRHRYGIAHPGVPLRDFTTAGRPRFSSANTEPNFGQELLQMATSISDCCTMSFTRAGARCRPPRSWTALRFLAGFDGDSLGRNPQPRAKSSPTVQRNGRKRDVSRRTWIRRK